MVTSSSRAFAPFVRCQFLSARKTPFVADVREALEAASKEMKEFNEIVRTEIIKESVNNHTGKTYYSGKLAAFTRYTN